MLTNTPWAESNSAQRVLLSAIETTESVTRFQPATVYRPTMSLTTLMARLKRRSGNSDHKITSELAEAAAERHEANLRALHPNEPRWGRGKGKRAKKNRKIRAADAFLALG